MIHRVSFDVLPKQGDFILSDAKETLFSSGVGGAKSVALCLKVVMRAASNPGAVEVLARRELESLYSTTYRTLLYGAIAPPVLPPGSYREYKKDKLIKLHGGGIIMLRAAGDRSQDQTQYKSGGLEPTGYAIDQIEELTKDEYERNVLARVRNTAGGTMTNQVYAACNPGPPSHWLADRFGVLDSTPVAGTRVIFTNPLENPYLTPEYIETLNSLTGLQYQRLVLGKWVGSDKLVYPSWNRARHLRPVNGPWKDAIIGIDDGYTAPMAALLWMQRSDGGWYQIREFYQQGLEESQRVGQIMELVKFAQQKGVTVSRIASDPENPSLINAMAAKGLPAVPAKNNVAKGIARFRAMLQPMPNGEPGIIVDPSCVNTAKNMESYELDPKSVVEKPIKRFDHACDAARYCAQEIDMPTSLVFDPSAMQNAIRRCRQRANRDTGTLMHGLEHDPRQELESIILRDVSQVAFIPGRDGELCMFEAIDATFKRPNQRTRYAVFAAVGNGGTIPTVVSIADISTRLVVGEMTTMDMTAEALARWLTILSVWLGGEVPAVTGWTRYGQGTTMAANLKAYGCPGLWTPIRGKEYGWEPTPPEKSDAVSLVRAAIENGRLIELAEEFFIDAATWAYDGKTAAPIRATDAVTRALWSDRVVSRAGLWMMIQGRQVPENKDPVDWVEALGNKQAKGKGLTFG